MSTETYSKYPITSVILYNLVTILHFLLGSAGIILGYDHVWWAYGLGIIYLFFSTSQMWILMPMIVCPNCAYYGIEDGRCASGMNIVSKRIAKPGDPRKFATRSEGLFCHNNLYMAGLIIPIIAMLPALVRNFSTSLLGILLSVIALFLFRIFVVFFRVACVHCLEKHGCPNSRSMGIDKLE